METSPDKSKHSGGHARNGPLLRTRPADAAPPRHRAPGPRSRGGTRARGGRPGTVAVAAGAVGVVAVLVGGAALLADRDEVPPSPSAGGARPSAAASPDASSRPSALPSSAAPSDASTTPAQELSPTVLAATGPARTVTAARAALEEQLAARAEAELALLRSTWTGDGAGATRAAQAVAASGAGLSAVLSTWWGSAVAGTISDGLDQRSEASRAYAEAVAAGDLAAGDQARARMAEVSRALGGVLDGLTQGRIAAYVPPQDAAQHRAFVDALQAGDTAAADEAATWLRGRLTREGAALAASLSGSSPS